MRRRFLLDQMLDADLAQNLRDLGYDVVRVSELGMARADDAEIMERAISDNRTLITLDHHFGDWAVLPLGRHPGVVRVKADPATRRNILDVLRPFLESTPEREFDSTLIIVRKTGVRWIKTRL
ncbi:MAG: putative nuclease of putative toxin-antitoxin system [Candidatus Promineifilaceae bacterium]